MDGDDTLGKRTNDEKNRTFSFSGAFTDGEFRGTHAEVGDDGEHTMGTLTLK